MNSEASLIWGIVFGAVGLAYFVFGKRHSIVLRHWVDGLSLFRIEYSSARYRGSRALGNPIFFKALSRN